jgi:hypothetical protein
MSRWAQGIYEVKNPQKYVGNGRPRYRSGWEHSFMRFCDTNDNVLQWASECVAIPYIHPITGRKTNYIPDFLITYRTKNNTIQAELIEIKPRNQSIIEENMNSRARAVVAVNYAKWAQAQKWCQRNGLKFRVINEQDMFKMGGR